jgi:glutaredoxin
MSYILYVKRDCPFCVQAEELLLLEEKEYSLIDIQDHPVLAEEIKKAYAWPTVPIVFSTTSMTNGSYRLIGGFSDLQNSINNLDKTDV